MHRWSRDILKAVCLLFVLVAPVNAGSSVKSAIANAKQDVATWTLVPKFDLGGRAEYDLRPDGTPLDGKQGEAHSGWLWTPKDKKTEVCLVGGTSYRMGEGPKWRTTRGSMGMLHKTMVVWFSFKAKKKELIVIVQSCVTFKIHYDRSVTATDLESEALAQVLGGFFDISGPNLTTGTEIEARLAEALGDSALETRPITATAPGHSHATMLHSAVVTIADVTVEASPSRAHRGQPVELILRYNILSPTNDLVEVAQSWTLIFNGQALPTYPTERQISRSRGSHEAALQQVIPDSAPVGIYKLKGEICVLEDCSTRTTTFEVLP